MFIVDAIFDLLFWLAFDRDGNKWVMPVLTALTITVIGIWVYVEKRLMKND